MSTIEALRAKGFRVEIWPCGEFASVQIVALEITDLKTAATVYVTESSSLEHCLEMIQGKNAHFKSAEQLNRKGE